MQEQTTFSAWLMIETIGLFVGGNVCFDKPGLHAILDLHERFLNAYLSRANRLDLTSLKRETRFESFQQKIFKACLAIGCYHFDVFSHMNSFYRLSHKFPDFWNGLAAKSPSLFRLIKLNVDHLLLMIKSHAVGLEVTMTRHRRSYNLISSSH